MRYDVVLVGFRLNASMKPAEALHSVLGMDTQTCRELTRQFPAQVLTGVSQSRAEKVAEQLTDVGAKVEVRESRLSHVSNGSQPFPTNEESGNYAIGEILAPMKRGSLAAPSDRPPPGPRRPSREELDEALRESFRPGELAGRRVPSSPPELRESTPGALPEILGNYTPGQDPAFAGMQSFDDGLETFDTRAAPALEVEEAAYRAIQRTPETAAARAARRGSPWTRLRRWLDLQVAAAAGWLFGFLWLTVISVVTLLAVAYAMDPQHVFTAFDDLPQAPARILRSAFGD